MSYILVTGGAGFIGSHVAQELIERGHKVVVLDDMSGGFTSNVPPNAELVQGSITDAKIVNELCSKAKFDYIYHLAAYAAESLSHFIKRFNYMNNVIGSVNLINAAVNTGVKCFVFTSSIAVYGSQPVLPMREDMQPMPEDSYGIAKYAVEQELAVSKHMFDLDYIIFRPHNVYGEKQNIGDKYRNVVGIFMNQILQNKPMSIFGDGTQSRAFSYIKDISPILADSIAIPSARNQIFNIGADQSYTVNDLATQIAHAMGVEPNIMYLPCRNEVQQAYSDHAKVQQIFGSHKSTPLDEGLSKMAKWVKSQGAKQSMKFEGIEIEKNLPLFWKS